MKRNEVKKANQIVKKKRGKRKTKKKRIKKSKGRPKTLRQFSAELFIFVLSFFLLSLLVHEIAHIALLEYFNCWYRFELFPKLGELEIHFRFACDISDIEAVAIYAVGILSELVLASLLLFSKNRLIMACALGMLAHASLYMIMDGGDVRDIASVTGIEELVAYSCFIGAVFLFLDVIAMLWLATQGERIQTTTARNRLTLLRVKASELARREVMFRRVSFYEAGRRRRRAK